MAGRAAPGRYTGADYRAVVAGRWGPADPLLHPDPYAPPRLYRVLTALLRWVLPRLFRIEMTGLDKLPPPPYILASNHQRWFDPLFLLLLLPSLPVVYSMARRDTVFNRGWKRVLVRRMGVFAIQPRQGELDTVGVASVYHVLSRGGVVLIFPEGRYSRGSALRPLKTGVAHFALQAGVPVVPVALDGLDRLRPFSRVRMTVGTPVWPDPPAWWTMTRRVTELVDSVRRALLRAFERPPAIARRPFWRRLRLPRPRLPRLPRPGLGSLRRLRPQPGRPRLPAAGEAGDAAEEAGATGPPGR